RSGPHRLARAGERAGARRAVAARRGRDVRGRSRHDRRGPVARGGVGRTLPAHGGRRGTTMALTRALAFDGVAFSYGNVAALSEVRRRTDEALDALDLHPHAAQHPYDLSPALRKLAALAGALALEPALLVLDEPTAGLDRAWRARVADAVREHAERGAALLVVTHDLAFAAETLERGIVLDRGRL